MSCFQHIRDDHKRIKGLFRQFEAVDLRAIEMKRGLVREIFMELEVHAQSEEEVFYPAVIGLMEPSMASLIEQSLSDHAAMKNSITTLRRLDPNSREFQNNFVDLIESVESHLESEERTVLPQVEPLLASRDVELGRIIAERRRILLRKPEYRQAQPSEVQNPNGGEQKRVRKTA